MNSGLEKGQNFPDILQSYLSSLTWIPNTSWCSLREFDPNDQQSDFVLGNLLLVQGNLISRLCYSVNQQDLGNISTLPSTGLYQRPYFSGLLPLRFLINYLFPCLSLGRDIYHHLHCHLLLCLILQPRRATCPYLPPTYSYVY